MEPRFGRRHPSENLLVRWFHAYSMVGTLKLPRDDRAVSPVIGVILMVAITVVLAAVVFVLVTKLSGNQKDTGESAQTSVTSPSSTKIYVTLIRLGQNGPYQITGTADVALVVDSTACTFDVVTGGTPGVASLQDTAATAGKWDAGETIIITPSATATDCLHTGGTNPATPGSTHLVSVTIHGTLVHDNTKVVLS